MTQFSRSAFVAAREAKYAAQQRLTNPNPIMSGWRPSLIRRGLTVYRDGSREGQVLALAAAELALARADTAVSGGRAGRVCEF